MALPTSHLLGFGVMLSMACQICVASNKFLSEHSDSVNEKAFRAELESAVGSMLGCGGEPDQKHVAAIKATLMPMWRTLPKNYDRIDRRSLRYLVHRYFMQTSSLMVRGFEPTRPVNEENWGAADILSQMVPAYVESVLDSKHSTQHGFSLQDAIDMVLMLDQLIFDSESTLLESVYTDLGKPMQPPLSIQGIKQVMEAYLIKWLVSETEYHARLIANRTLAAEVLPHYSELMKFVEGRIRTLDYERQYARIASKKTQSRDVWAMKYSFEEAHDIAGGITKSFQSYWQSECDTMKVALVGMDVHTTGRVPLSKFYNTAVNTDWRFGESESYLRELGALDETSSWLGPQVIIPNYLQATSNCIVSTAHYLVCCVNECESLLGDIETAIDASTASPSNILKVVRNITSQTTLDTDEPPHLNAGLVSQLEQIAKKHGGMVPLHGRLFAQWIHYVFPHECPFPHKAGMVSAVTPAEYGDEHIATTEDMRKHASNASAFDFVESVGKEELQWMSQWSPDEELLVDYSSELSGPWQGHLMMIIVGLLFIVGGVWGGSVGLGQLNANQKSNSILHSHLV
jgi:hypothetical protein